MTGTKHTHPIICIKTGTTHTHPILCIKVTLWSFWNQVGGYFLLDYSVIYLLSCFVLFCTCLMFDCVRKVVDSLVCHKQSKLI